MSAKIYKARMIMSFREMLELSQERENVFDNRLDMNDQMLEYENDISAETFVERTLENLYELGKVNSRVRATHDVLSEERQTKSLVNKVEERVKNDHAELLGVDERIEDAQGDYLRARFAYSDAGGICLDCEIDLGKFNTKIYEKSSLGVVLQLAQIYERDVAPDGKFHEAIREAGLEDHVLVEPYNVEHSGLKVSALIFSETAKDKVVDIMSDLMSAQAEGYDYHVVSKEGLEVVLKQSVETTNLVNRADCVLPLKDVHINLNHSRSSTASAIEKVDNYLEERKSSKHVEKDVGVDR